MRRIAVAVYSLLISGISKLTGLSDARVSVKFMIALLAVMLPCGVVTFTTSLRATSNIITVNNRTDPASTSGNGFCTLREAINNANAASDTSGGDCAPGTGTDTIKFSVSGTITLVQGTLPAIANSSPGSLTIDGSGQTITVDGANSFRVLQVNGGATLSLNSLTIAHGNGGAGDGGAIYNVGTSLTITNCTLSGNSSTTSGGSEGGAILSSGSVLTVDNSNFSDNSAGLVQNNGSGGAIAAGGTATITNSTFSGNSASVGGAIFDLDAENNVTVRNSTFTTNSAFNNGGAIACSGVLITNSTFNGNTAGVNGGGVVWTKAVVSGSEVR
jgi:predicted outer membrane repeat protein